MSTSEPQPTATAGAAGAATAAGSGGGLANAVAGAGGVSADTAADGGSAGHLSTGSAGHTSAGSTGSAGSSGTGAAVAGSAAVDAGAAADADDAGATPDAGTAPDAATSTVPEGSGISVLAEATFGPPVELSVDMQACANGRCVLDAAAPRGFSVELSLSNAGFDAMPVLAGWEGCGEPSWSLRAVWSGLNYTAIYTTPFENVAPPATCRASIVQGSWLTFAGNLDLHVSAGAVFCSEQATSPESLNQLCFAPPGTKIEVTSGLPKWSCLVASDPMSFEMQDKTEPLVITTVAQQLVSCVAERE